MSALWAIGVALVAFVVALVSGIVGGVRYERVKQGKARAEGQIDVIKQRGEDEQEVVEKVVEIERMPCPVARRDAARALLREAIGERRGDGSGDDPEGSI